MKQHITKLRNWEKNPRAIKKDKFEELKKRLQRFGQFKPLIVTGDGEVLGGNMRLRAMKELGISDVWVSVVSPQTEAEKVEIALSDNEEMGYYEADALAELVSQYKDQIQLSDYSVHIGEPVDLSELLQQYAPDEIVEDEVPELTDEAVSRLGEVYQLGRHRLMCGDATKIEDVDKLMNGQKADMVLTDPPYGIEVVANNGSTGGTNLAQKGTYSPVIGDDSIQTAIDTYNLCASLNIEKMIFWGGNYYASALPNARCWIVWDKENTGSYADGELAWTNLNGGVRIYRQMWNGMIREGESDKRVHPTQKPIKLMADIIIEYEGNNILDLFGGSGSTLIACEQTNRTCYMMELDPKYCDVIRKRYAKFIGKENEWETVTPQV